MLSVGSAVRAVGGDSAPPCAAGGPSPHAAADIRMECNLMFGIDNNAMEKMIDLAQAEKDKKQYDSLELLEVLKSIDLSLKDIACAAAIYQRLHF